MLTDEGLEPWPKLTGGKGVHLTVPLEPTIDHDQARAYARRIAQRLAATVPDRYTPAAAPEKRTRRIFLDYLRNGRGTTAVGAWSPRARAGFPVAAPVSWRQIQNGITLALAPDQFDLAFAFQVLEHLPEPRLVLDQLVRLTRPGGLVLVHTDMDTRERAGGFERWWYVTPPVEVLGDRAEVEDGERGGRDRRREAAADLLPVRPGGEKQLPIVVVLGLGQRFHFTGCMARAAGAGPDVKPRSTTASRSAAQATRPS